MRNNLKNKHIKYTNEQELGRIVKKYLKEDRGKRCFHYFAMST